MAQIGLKSTARKKRRLYLLLTSMAVLGLAVFLVLSALEDSIRLFYDPTEVVEKNIPEGQSFRLGGLVEGGSYRKQETDGALINKFIITDGNKTVSVVYEGLLPDLFREGQGVVAEGKLNGSGVFMASEVLAKHDENYMPKEVIDSLKKRGQWQHDGTEASAATDKEDTSW